MTSPPAAYDWYLLFFYDAFILPLETTLIKSSLGIGPNDNCGNRQCTLIATVPIPAKSYIKRLWKMRQQSIINWF